MIYTHTLSNPSPLLVNKFVPWKLWETEIISNDPAESQQCATYQLHVSLTELNGIKIGSTWKAFLSFQFCIHASCALYNNRSVSVVFIILITKSFQFCTHALCPLYNNRSVSVCRYSSHCSHNTTMALILSSKFAFCWRICMCLSDSSRILNSKL